MELSLDDLFQLVYHYKTQDRADPFNDAIDLAETALGDVLDTEREYPPFIYYLILINMQNRKRWYDMSDEEKTEEFHNTIKRLRELAG